MELQTEHFQDSQLERAQSLADGRQLIKVLTQFASRYMEGITGINMQEAYHAHENAKRYTGLEHIGNPDIHDEMVNMLPGGERDLEALWDMNFAYNPSEKCFVRPELSETDRTPDSEIDALRKGQFTDSEWNKYTGRSKDPKTVVVAGVGTAGSRFIQTAQSGFNAYGDFVLLDPDIVENGNTAQQGYTRQDVGYGKAVASARKLINETGASGSITIYPQGLNHENIETILEDASFVAEGIDVSVSDLAIQLHEKARETATRQGREIHVFTPFDMHEVLATATRTYPEDDALYRANNDEELTIIDKLKVIGYTRESSTDPAIRAKAAKLGEELGALTLIEPIGPIQIGDIPMSLIQTVAMGEKLHQYPSTAAKITAMADEFIRGAIKGNSEYGSYRVDANGASRPNTPEMQTAILQQQYAMLPSIYESYQDSIQLPGYDAERSNVWEVEGLSPAVQYRELRRLSEGNPEVIYRIQNNSHDAIQSFSSVILDNYTRAGFIGPVSDIEGRYPPIEIESVTKGEKMETPFIVAPADFSLDMIGLTDRIKELGESKGFNRLIGEHFLAGKGIIIRIPNGEGKTTEHYVDAYTEKSQHFQVVIAGKTRVTTRLTDSRESEYGLTTPTIDQEAVTWNNKYDPVTFSEQNMPEFGHIGGDKRALLSGVKGDMGWGLVPAIMGITRDYSEREGINKWFASVDSKFLERIIKGMYKLTMEPASDEPTDYMGSLSEGMIAEPAKGTEDLREAVKLLKIELGNAPTDKEMSSELARLEWIIAQIDGPEEPA